MSFIYESVFICIDFFYYSYYINTVRRKFYERDDYFPFLVVLVIVLS